MIPAPFVIIEYGIKTLNYFKSIINGEAIEENNSFRNRRLFNVNYFSFRFFNKFLVIIVKQRN